MCRRFKSGPRHRSSLLANTRKAYVRADPARGVNQCASVVHHGRVPTEIQKVLFNAVLDDFGHGEPVEFLIDVALKDLPGQSPASVIDELRKAVGDGLMRVWLVNSDGSESEATDADYEQAVATYVANEERSYVIADSLVATLTCPGQAVWRTIAEPWQLELSQHGRVAEDERGGLTISAQCVEMARQLLTEWLTAHPHFTVEEPPRVEVVNFSLSPGFPMTGKRMTWRVLRRDRL